MVTITNPASNTAALAGVAFNDIFPGDMLVAGAPNNTCGGTFTAGGGSNTITLAGGTIPINSSCEVDVVVTATNGGADVNTTQAVTSTNGGTGGTASATLGVQASPTITSGSATTFQFHAAGQTFTVTATGFPVPTFSETGYLPNGITFTSGGVLSGTPNTVGTFPITITATNGVAPDATQDFVLTVARLGTATYTQPFNNTNPNPHNWTYTIFTACNEAAGGIGAAGSCASNAAYATNCAAASLNVNANQCIEASATSGTGFAVPAGGMSGYFRSGGTLTWALLGVPAAATVTQVQGMWYDHTTTNCGTGTSAGIEILDALNNEATLGGALGFQDVTADTAGVTHTGTPMPVIAADQSANTTIFLRFDLDPQTATQTLAFTGVTCNLSGDNYQLIITYTLPGGRIGQVIVGSNRDSDGPFGKMIWHRAEPSEN